jgi:hypothetical protein
MIDFDFDFFERKKITFKTEIYFKLEMFIFEKKKKEHD